MLRVEATLQIEAQEHGSPSSFISTVTIKLTQKFPSYVISRVYTDLPSRSFSCYCLGLIF